MKNEKDNKNGKNNKKDKKIKKELKMKEKLAAEVVEKAGKKIKEAEKPKKLSVKEYEKVLEKLQLELVRLQDWVKATGERIVVVIEGRDAAGKGGVIKRIMERVSTRVYRVVALPVPSDREKTQLYFQRYIQHFPAAGEIVIFDRSWYNRAGVERVMGFCTEEQAEAFLQACPVIEGYIVNSGIRLIKYFFDISQEEQQKRFKSRMEDETKQWKFSPMDIESYRLWWDYTRAYDRMLEATDTKFAPWYIVQANDKKKARLNCIAHLLSQIPYEDLPYEKPKLPKPKKKDISTPETPRYKNWVPEVY